VVSTFYNTVAMLRTIEDVLGLEHLSVHDAGVGPMTDAFDIFQNCSAKRGGGAPCWTYSATPSQFLCNTTLPVPACANVDAATIPKPTHDAAWCAAETRGMDFSKEDLNDPQAFNRIIWEGTKGTPYPTTRSGAELRHSGTPQPETKQVERSAGSN
jgi:hypothetical protein